MYMYIHIHIYICTDIYIYIHMYIIYISNSLWHGTACYGHYTLRLSVLMCIYTDVIGIRDDWLRS